MSHTEHCSDRNCLGCTEDDCYFGECIECGEEVDLRECEDDDVCPHCGEDHAIGQGYDGLQREDFHADV